MENLTWLPFSGYYKNWEDGRKSFVDAGLAKPGTLVEFEDGKILLVGDINPTGGICNCCGLKGINIVVRYAVVYSPQPKGDTK